MDRYQQKKIAIVWEGFEAGGVDSYLAYLLDAWPANDHIHIFHNAENKGIARLQSIMVREDVTFSTVKTVFKFYDRKSGLSILKKYLFHLAAPILFLTNVLLYKKELLSHNFDVLMAQNGGYPGSYGVLASCLAGYSAGVNTRVLVVHHAARSPLPGHGFFRRYIEQQLTKRLDSVIAISVATKRTIMQHTKLFTNNADKIVVIENGVPVPEVKKTEFTSINFVQKVAIIGRLDIHKGHTDFLEALYLLSNDDRRKVYVEFIGGYKEDDLKRVADDITKYGLSDIVKITGYLDVPVADIIIDLDLVVVATRDFEGFGLTIVEALHANVPVLATEVGIVPELFGEENVMAVPPGDVERMKEALQIFLSAENRRMFILPEMRERLKKYDSRYAAVRYRAHLESKGSE